MEVGYHKGLGRCVGYQGPGTKWEWAGTTDGRSEGSRTTECHANVHEGGWSAMPTIRRMECHASVPPGRLTECHARDEKVTATSITVDGRRQSGRRTVIVRGGGGCFQGDLAPGRDAH